MRRSVLNLEIPPYCRPQTEICHVSDIQTSNNSGILYSGNSTRNVFRRPPVLRSRNFLDCLANNQSGLKLNHVFQDDVIGFKVQNSEPKKIFEFPKNDNIYDVYMLRGGYKVLWGWWVIDAPPYEEYSFFAFEHSDKRRIPNHDLWNKLAVAKVPLPIMDFCGMKTRDPSLLLFVANATLIKAGYVYRMVHRGELSEAFPGAVYRSKLDCAVWSCCTNSFNSNFALGVENGILVRSHTSIYSTFSRELEGQVYSVNFNKNGNIIYAGVNTGHVIITDTRAGAKEYEMIKIQNSALNETVILDDERYLICGGHDNLLCKMDLRMGRIAINYSGDIRSAQRIRISINEAFNLLCSTGFDNVTRLWYLSSGKLLKSIYPPVPGHKCRSWLNDDSSECSLYTAQQNKLYLYEF